MVCPDPQPLLCIWNPCLATAGGTMCQPHQRPHPVSCPPCCSLCAFAKLVIWKSVTGIHQCRPGLWLPRPSLLYTKEAALAGCPGNGERKWAASPAWPHQTSVQSPPGAINYVYSLGGFQNGLGKQRYRESPGSVEVILLFNSHNQVCVHLYQG